MIKEIFYGPGDWVANKTSARQRRAFGFWTLFFAAIGAVFFGSQVLYVSILSVVALIPNLTSETPVEQEAKIDAQAN